MFGRSRMVREALAKAHQEQGGDHLERKIVWLIVAMVLMVSALLYFTLR